MSKAMRKYEREEAEKRVRHFVTHVPTVESLSKGIAIIYDTTRDLKDRYLSYMYLVEQLLPARGALHEAEITLFFAAIDGKLQSQLPKPQQPTEAQKVDTHDGK